MDERQDEACSTAKDGTYTCTIVGSGVFTWNPKKTVTVTAPKGTRGIQTHLGQHKTARTGQRVRVGASPIFFVAR